MRKRGDMPDGGRRQYEIVKRYIKSIGKGILKVMSKMGISTYQSYCGAQIFDAVGLSSRAGRASTSPAPPRSIDGVGLDEIAAETVDAPPPTPSATRRCCRTCARRRRRLRSSACAARRMPGTPETVAVLQHAVRGSARGQVPPLLQAGSNEAGAKTLRRSARLFTHPQCGRDQTASRSRWTRSMPAVDIVRRFVTGAMSFGSISREAHTTLARRHEPASAASRTPARAARRRTRFKPLPEAGELRCARRSSRWPPAASA